MRKSDVIEYREQIRQLWRRANYRLDFYEAEGISNDDARVIYQRGYVDGLLDALAKFRELKSARLRINGHSDPGA